MVFKGSGFYITDYKRAGEKKTDQKDAESKPAAETKPATESKPADSAKKKPKPGDK